jgi:tRNA(Ile2) C34 agmatinyltransferase TiaS
MERIFVRCPECNDYMEAEFRKGNWYCENCGKNLNTEVKRYLDKSKKLKK